MRLQRTMALRWAAVLLLLPIPGLLLGCSHFNYSDNLYVDKSAFAANANMPHSLAVLPFTNSSGVAQAGGMMRVNLYTQLARLGYHDVELTKVDSTLSQLAVNYHLNPDEIPPPLIRESGLADVVLSGQVKELSKRWALIYSHIRVSMQLQLTDTRTNKVIYRNQATGTNFTFTAPTSIIGILTGAWSTFHHLGTQETEDTIQRFASRIVETFPNPSAIAGQGGLVLRDVIMSIPHNPMHPGDELLVEFHGTPGTQATIDLGDAVKGIRVPEIEPGSYRVTYTIAPNTKDQYVVVRVRLMQEPGKQVEVSLYQQPFSIRSGASSQPVAGAGRSHSK